MFYKLKERFILRGWERLPYAVQDRRTGITVFLDEPSFQTASFCNGLVDVDSPFILQKHRDAIHKMEKAGMIEKCAYGDQLEDYQRYRKMPCRFIRRAHWSITGKCNLRCRHCYMSAPQAKYGELSHEQCMNIVQQLSDAGIAQVSLTGGEPLVRSDFLDIVDALLEHNIVITQIYTNGLLVNEKLLDELDIRGIKPEFSLSFDGVGCHDWMRGLEGAEQAALDAIKLLKSRGFHVAIETALYTGNIGTLADTLKVFMEIGVDIWKTSPATDVGNWANEQGKYTLSVQELYRAYLDFIPQYKAAGAPLQLMLGGFFLCEKGSDKYKIPCKKFDGRVQSLRYSVCQSARNTMYISADGKLLPCIPLTGTDIQDEMPDILETNLIEALSDSNYLKLINMRLEDLLKENEECNQCEHILYCGGGCRASALVCSGLYTGIDSHTCYFFKHGYEQKIRAIYEHLQ